MKKFLLFFIVPFQFFAQDFTQNEIKKWQEQAANITIVRDNWGIPHVYGKTDADAVFGLMYAQCEDDFNRVEMNYIDKLGRLAEVKGEASLYDDLLIRLVINEDDAKTDYKKAPQWLKKILNAYADGINFYLFKNPQVKPLLLKRFEPWYPLLWTDGSIGAISTAGISVTELKNFFEDTPNPITLSDITYKEEKPVGSNGFAFSPKITASGNAILYINPHVTFYFRPEVHMISEEGLNAYGAVTWGQPFVYQGFNEKCGWMHTSSQSDISDAYIEKLSVLNNKWFYEYDGKLRPVTKKKIQIKYKTKDGLKLKIFDAMFTHHGPILAKRDGSYLSLKHNNRDTNGFIQSWLRTKATSFDDFKKTMDMGANPSNNTVYADAEGNIAYWHGNFLPKRDPAFDWNNPVDGSTSTTEWKGFHSVAESVHLYNPPNGWLQNCNSTPFTVAGTFSPKIENYPNYLAPDGENYRGLNAVRILSRGEQNYTLDKVIADGYDLKLTAFEDLIPSLIKAFESDQFKDQNLKDKLAAPISVLINWNFYTNEKSVATTISIEWAQRLQPFINKTDGSDVVEKTRNFANGDNFNLMLKTLNETIDYLVHRYGKWDIAWGEINRFQRITSDIDNNFDDDKPSYPVAFASSAWGMLPSYNSRSYDGTLKRYGVSGNSFVAAVEFGKKVVAKSLLAGGQNSNPSSPHFFDQGEMYSKGQFKDVLFYKKDVLKNAVKIYHPGN
ncbi:MAG: penicillin acylase family protein [Bacteroidetes bacterium]|nr:penicillin acylase family protein [Bacteroidota bacterium]